MSEVIYQAHIKTPLGKLLAVASEHGLCAVDFSSEDRPDAVVERVSRQYPDPKWQQGMNCFIKAAEDWFKRYFHADFASLRDIPLDLIGTEFEKKIWSALMRIPLGQLASYGELATAAGSPGAARAVGGAVGRNPIGIIIPCHRIIGGSRTLTGYGGGLERKQWLLRHEGFTVSGQTRSSCVSGRDVTTSPGKSLVDGHRE